jgi:CheY-like chemotaxis protein
MLASAGIPGDAARCRDLGIAAYLPKPVSRAALQEALVLALGAPPNETHARPLVTRHSLRENRPPVRILLVDDDGVTQLLAKRVLEKRGYTVDVARNGREALARLDRPGVEGFDCVLMDIHMPDMDGLACTAGIRERELATQVHLPIILMTADVTGEDEARGRAAGIDAYLTKPIVLQELFELVDQHAGTSSMLPVRHTGGAQDATYPAV